MTRATALLLWALCAQPAAACQTALLLAIDVSNSIDPSEYRLQIDGLTAALADPLIIEELVAGQVALSLVQWSGQDQAAVSLPWTQMQSPAHVARFAQAAASLPRAYRGSNTAIGHLIRFGLTHLQTAPACARRVIDISGDGQENANSAPLSARRQAERLKVQINGIAIERSGRAITNYYRAQVRSRDGFVLTARGYRDYPRALREKIKREIARVLF